LLGHALYDPLHVWLAPKDERPASIIHRLAHRLEEMLVQAIRWQNYQHPAHPLTYVLVGVQGTLGDIVERTCAHLDGLFAV
jgi:hypothetical protein